MKNCQCSKCVNMCRSNPCWPTPDEARALITAGFADRLMTDWWEAYPDDILLLCPASRGSEGTRAPELDNISDLFAGWSKGACVFLTEANLCELHDLGLKPLEGKMAMHDSTAEECQTTREHIVELWKTEQNNFNFAK